MQEERIISALDIGSSKVAVLVARVHPSNEIELIGLGVSESLGIRSGSVTHLEEIAVSIREAIEEAEIMAGIDIQDVLINITGKHVKGENSTGVIAITNKDRIITSQDIYRVISAAQSIRMPTELDVLHVLSREFKVDEQDGIKDPTGMVGIRLEVDVHIVTTHKTQLHNTVKTVQETGIMVNNQVLSSLADSHSLLGEGEKELGIAIADIGGGVTDIIIYLYGGVFYTSTICLGSQHVTHDISIGLKTPLSEAEVIKKKYANCISSNIDPIEQVEVTNVGNRSPKSVFRKELAIIVEARMKEILELIDHELIKSGQKKFLSGGLILTGGGSLIEDLPTLAEEIIGLNTSIGYPRNISGIADKIASPIFSTSAGLLYYGVKYNSYQGKQNGGFTFLGKMKNWIKENL